MARRKRNIKAPSWDYKAHEKYSIDGKGGCVLREKADKKKVILIGEPNDTTNHCPICEAKAKKYEKIIDDEPECPGPMPDEMWQAINGDKDATEEVIRIAIRTTKANIKSKLKALGKVG